MTWWIRGLAKRIFGRIMGEAPKEKAFKYMAIARIGYFMSTVTLAVVVLKSKRDYEAQILEQGKPMIEDKSPSYGAMRRSKAEAGLMFSYEPGKGFSSKEYHRGEYLSQLEKEAYERVRGAQEKAIAEGRELGPGAIKLVE